MLIRRLASKEQEVQDFMLQVSEYKAAQIPSAAALRNALLDPAVNILFQKLKQELQATKAKLEETQNELSAWKFTPDSNTGKRLMAKCRLLYQENEELGKMTSNGRLAKLEASLASHKTLYEEVKKSQSELDDFLQEIDEDVEGMQSTILFLQQELKSVREQNEQMKHELSGLKTPSNGTTAAGSSTNGSSEVVTNSDLIRTQSANGDHEEGEIENGENENGDVSDGEIVTHSNKRPLDVEPTVQSETNITKRTRRAAAVAAAAAVAGDVPVVACKKLQQLTTPSVESANGVV